MSIFSNSVNSDVPKIDPSSSLNVQFWWNLQICYQSIDNQPKFHSDINSRSKVMQVSIWPVTIPRPRADPRATNFFHQNPHPRTAFSAKLRPPGRKNETKIPTHGHNLPSSNAKISMTKEHNSIKAVSFQIFHNCPFDNFLFLWE